MFRHKIKLVAFAAGLTLTLVPKAIAADLYGNRGGGYKDGGAIDDRHVLWRGIYAGVTVGGGSSTVIVEKPGKDSEFSRSYASVGGFVGYNFTSGPWVIGLEADISSGGPNTSKTDRLLGRITKESGALGSVRARAGYASDNFLLYGTVGVAFTDYQLKTASRAKAEFDTGLAFGAGAEWAFAPQWTARLEGLVYAFGDDDVLIAGAKRDVVVGDAVVRVGIARRF